ncbi:hypothetical protein ES332_D12G291600v1 [Gossypium tomentosum]|uniref:Uncharacterized protein n=1 Tax=Gossypium tomentosum TaxID=34277 RepID=A0A5D2IES1_GOSTO|nr:hypothetical protein ES332_D12G291600v1 [Gossypium tomentosum]
MYDVNASVPYKVFFEVVDESTVSDSNFKGFTEFLIDGIVLANFLIFVVDLVLHFVNIVLQVVHELQHVFIAINFSIVH